MKNYLLERIQKLTISKDQLVAHINAHNGAIEEAQLMLNKLLEDNKNTPPSNDDPNKKGVSKSRRKTI